MDERDYKTWGDMPAVLVDAVAQLEHEVDAFALAVAPGAATRQLARLERAREGLREAIHATMVSRALIYGEDA